MNDLDCRKCEHTREDHPNGFLCAIDNCRCPGYFATRHPDREDLT